MLTLISSKDVAAAAAARGVVIWLPTVPILAPGLPLSPQGMVQSALTLLAAAGMGSAVISLVVRAGPPGPEPN